VKTVLARYRDPPFSDGRMTPFSVWTESEEASPVLREARKTIILSSWSYLTRFAQVEMRLPWGQANASFCHSDDGDPSDQTACARRS